MACTFLGLIMSEPRNSQTRLPAVVWEKLLEAAPLVFRRVVIPGQPDPIQNHMILRELKRRVCFGELGRSDRYDNYTHPISFEDALCTSEHFVWSLLWPFDNHEGDPLDSEKVQRLLSLVNAFSLYSPVVEGNHWHEIVLGTWQQIICGLQVGSVTRKDQDAICVAADIFLRQRAVFQTTFGPAAVILPTLSFLYCCQTPTSHSARTDIVLALIEIDMFAALRALGHIEYWLWSYGGVNHATSALSLCTSVIRASFESRSVGSASCSEDSCWLEYLSLPENSAAIVSIFTFQGSLRTPASVAQVRDDLSLFFASRSWDCELLQKCKASLEDYLEDLILPDFHNAYRPNIKEAKRVIDELIAEQSPKPANMLNRLLRRSRQSTDTEAAR
ncbi:hypothetical protein CPB85DRAFT_1564856 [Mucidula mucida]|nr:hypothetical protein CPB85DRAFT_1564856 [Mucidula mucida]